MGRISAPLPPMPKDPTERAAFMRAYLKVQRRPPVDSRPWDTGFKIHDAGWAIIGMAFAIVALTIYAISTLA